MTHQASDGKAKPVVAPTAHGYRHEALFYSGTDDLVERAAAFVRQGIEEGEPTLAVLQRPKLDRLRRALGPAADGVRFADMETVGRNPGRVIAAWRQFVAQNGGTGQGPVPGLRGIGEPIWPGRPADERAECHLNESLLNVAFEDSVPLWLLCPYDTVSLPSEDLRRALENHPYVDGHRRPVASSRYRPLDPGAPFDRELPPPPPGVPALAFDARQLPAVRRLVRAEGRRLGLSPGRLADLALTATELATNSVLHGDGQGTLRIWEAQGAVVCEVADGGHLDQPLAGRLEPPAASEGGRGLWLANQLCDLVQIQSGPGGTRVRVRLAG